MRIFHLLSSFEFIVSIFILTVYTFAVEVVLLELLKYLLLFSESGWGSQGSLTFLVLLQFTYHLECFDHRSIGVAMEEISRVLSSMHQKSTLHRRDALALLDLGDHLLPEHFLGIPCDLALACTRVVGRQVAEAEVLELQAETELPNVLLQLDAARLEIQGKLIFIDKVKVTVDPSHLTFLSDNILTENLYKYVPIEHVINQGDFNIFVYFDFI